MKLLFLFATALFISTIHCIADEHGDVSFDQYLELLANGKVNLAAYTNDSHILSTSERLIIGGHSMLLLMTKTEAAFWRTYYRTNRIDSFREIISTATPAGKAYGLLGLYYANREQYDAAAAPCRNSTNAFERKTGCVIYNNTLGEFTTRLEGNVFEPMIKAAQQSVAGYPPQGVGSPEP